MTGRGKENSTSTQVKSAIRQTCRCRSKGQGRALRTNRTDEKRMKMFVVAGEAKTISPLLKFC